MKHLHHFVSILLLLMVLQVSDAMAGTPVQPKTTTYDFKNFNSLTLSGIVKVYFTQGKHYSIKVEESNSPYLKTIVELKGQVLSSETAILAIHYLMCADGVIHADEEEKLFGILVKKDSNEFIIGQTDVCNCSIDASFKKIEKDDSEFFKKIEEIISKKII